MNESITIPQKIEAAKASGQFIDYYCERIAGDFGAGFGEPLNTITNIAFLIAAFFIFKKIYSEKTWFKFDIVILASALACIGIGSAIYHSKPSADNELLDVIPISIFIHLYLVSFFMRVLKYKIWQAFMVLAAFIYAGYWTGANLDPQTLNGTIMYIPTYLMLLVMLAHLHFHKNTNTKYFLITAIIWSFSLAFRTIDIPACEQTLGIGTHIFWHILNAVVLYRLVRLL